MPSENMIKLKELTKQLTPFPSGEEMFKSFIRQLTDSVIVINNKNEIKMFNDSSEKIFQYKSDEVRYKKVDKLIPTKYKKAYMNCISQYFETGKQSKCSGKSFDAFGLAKDGKIISIGITLSPGVMNGEQYLFCTIRDITRRKTIQKQLKKENMILSKSLKSIDGLYCTTEENSTKFIKRSDNWQTITKYSNEELDDMGVIGIFQDKKLYLEYRKKPSTMINNIITKSGEKIPYKFTSKKINIENKIYLIEVGTIDKN